MKILGIGGGAREHAIAEKLMQSRYDPAIFWIGEWRNPGIHRICRETRGEYMLGSTTDPAFICKKAKEMGVDMVVIGPEEPNFHGVPDMLEREGVACIGTPSDVAIIEQSKAALRRLQWEYDLPGKLLFKTFRSFEEARSILKEYEDSLSWMQNVVLKPARQAGGKGVKVIEDRQAYLFKEKHTFKLSHAEWLERYMRGYSDIDDKILIEENVWGPEYTLQCFTDGRVVAGLPIVQDNKHAFDFDIGPETGGMGSIAGPGLTLPFITPEEYEESLKIVEATVKAIQDKTGMLYRGIVAGQMMLTEIEGPTVIEMYSRLGDPEALNVLAMLETDLIDICYAIHEQRLSKISIKLSGRASVVKAIAPEGYPDDRAKAKGHEISVREEEIARKGCRLYWGSANMEDGRILTAGSRTLELMAEGETHEEASSLIDSCMPLISLSDGWRLFYRKDIGSRELMARRSKIAEHARRLYSYRKSRGILGRRIDWVPGIGKINPSRVLLEEVRGRIDA